MSVIQETVAFTATGASPVTHNAVAEMSAAAAQFALQVRTVSGSVSTVSVVVEGSLNGTAWTTLVTASSVGPVVGLTAVPYPVLFWRVRCATLTGTNPNISVVAVAGSLG